MLKQQEQGQTNWKKVNRPAGGLSDRERASQRAPNAEATMASGSYHMGEAQQSPRGPFTGSHMLNIKNARLRSEHDVNLLRNRLERLRMEERKALKKIEETRRRADQIVSLKTRNEENHMRKLLEAEYANKQLERARARLQGHRAGMQDAIRRNAEEMLQQKREDAEVMRDQSRRINEHVRQQKAVHVNRARCINAMIKEHSMEVQQDKMRSRMEHEETLQAEMEERMLAEERRRNVADRLIADMEEAEEIAIERLRRTQEAQKAAYEELERALGNPPPPLDQRQVALGMFQTSGAQPFS